MIWSLIPLSLFASPSAFADGPNDPRTISVSGDAEIKVVPDQVILTLVVDTLEKDVVAAKQQNDERVKKILALVQGFKVAPKHIQTDQMTLEARYRNYEKKEFLGYGARKTIVVCFKDMRRFEDLILEALKAGTNEIQGIEFQSTSLRKHRDEARLMAIKAAREKATALAGALGQKIGRPRRIVENSVSHGRRTAYAQNVNDSGNAGGDSGSEDTGFAPGQIAIRASVSVVFELSD